MGIKYATDRGMHGDVAGLDTSLAAVLSRAVERSHDVLQSPAWNYRPRYVLAFEQLAASIMHDTYLQGSPKWKKCIWNLSVTASNTTV